ncbi:MAG: hypothetical protein HY849_09750 [Nitrosomonadales bacterium]|nr:hypothetical protein [Nitrosomonadales bacterium]
MRCAPLLIATLLLVACAHPAGKPNANAGRDGKEIVRVGVVESVSPKDMPDEGGSSGYFFGGTMGSIGGAVLGSGRGSVVGSVLGGTLGGNAGGAAQNSGIIPGQEIWVKLDGKTDPLIIDQEVKPGLEFKVGERVRVVRGKRGQEQLEHESVRDEPEPSPTLPKP